MKNRKSLRCGVILLIPPDLEFAVLRFRFILWGETVGTQTITPHFQNPWGCSSMETINRGLDPRMLLQSKIRWKNFVRQLQFSDWGVPSHAKRSDFCGVGVCTAVHIAIWKCANG
jgi:hypothetical protein